MTIAEIHDYCAALSVRAYTPQRDSRTPWMACVARFAALASFAAVEDLALLARDADVRARLTVGEVRIAYQDLAKVLGAATERQAA